MQAQCQEDVDLLLKRDIVCATYPSRKGEKQVTVTHTNFKINIHLLGVNLYHMTDMTTETKRKQNYNIKVPQDCDLVRII